MKMFSSLPASKRHSERGHGQHFITAVVTTARLQNQFHVGPVETGRERNVPLVRSIHFPESLSSRPSHLSRGLFSLPLHGLT